MRGLRILLLGVAVSAANASEFLQKPVVDEIGLSDAEPGFFIADNFTISGENATVDTVTWRGVYWNTNTPQSDNFVIRIYKNSPGNLPGEIETTIAPGSGVTRIDTYLDWYDPTTQIYYDIYEYRASVGHQLEEPSLPYWMAIWNNTNNDDDDNWYWGAAKDQGNLVFGVNPGENSLSWLNGLDAVYLAINDDAQVYPIPAQIDVESAIIHPHHDGSLGPQGIAALPDDPIPVVVFGLSKAVGDDANLATDDINPATLAFGPGSGGVSPVHPPEFNVNKDSDGQEDARFRFLMSDAGFGCSDSAGTLNGSLLTGEPFVASDTFTSDCGAVCH